jgi:hypothetical protein
VQQTVPARVQHSRAEDQCDGYRVDVIRFPVEAFG